MVSVDCKARRRDVTLAAGILKIIILIVMMADTARGAVYSARNKQ